MAIGNLRPATGPDLLDELTGLYNSRQFHALLEAEVERVRRYSGRLALLLLDIDQFRRFNERYGHAEGDRLLAYVGQLLLSGLRKIDSACRYGGEEFIVILPGCEPKALFALAERVRRELSERPFVLEGGREVTVTVSIGATCYRPGISIETFIHDLDSALQQAKQAGRNRVELKSLLE